LRYAAGMANVVFYVIVFAGAGVTGWLISKGYLKEMAVPSFGVMLSFWLIAVFARHWLRKMSQERAAPETVAATAEGSEQSDGTARPERLKD
jgi:hypothetical protein